MFLGPLTQEQGSRLQLHPLHGIQDLLQGVFRQRLEHLEANMAWTRAGEPLKQDVVVLRRICFIRGCSASQVEEAMFLIISGKAHTNTRILQSVTHWIHFLLDPRKNKIVDSLHLFWAPIVSRGSPPVQGGPSAGMVRFSRRHCRIASRASRASPASAARRGAALRRCLAPGLVGRVLTA